MVAPNPWKKPCLYLTFFPVFLFVPVPDSLIHISTRQLPSYLEKKHYHIGKKVPNVGFVRHPDTLFQPNDISVGTPFYWAKVWIYLWNKLHRIYLVIYFLEESWKKETYETFRLYKHVNVLQLPIANTAAVLCFVYKCYSLFH